MAVKRYGANTVLGAALVLWSTVTLCTGFVQTYAQCLVMRLLLGAAEAGLFPALSFVISTIWDRQNQAKRVSLLYMSSALSGAFGGLFAYGVQSMGRQRGLDAWRWLFVRVRAKYGHFSANRDRSSKEQLVFSSALSSGSHFRRVLKRLGFCPARRKQSCEHAKPETLCTPDLMSSTGDTSSKPSQTPSCMQPPLCSSALAFLCSASAPSCQRSSKVSATMDWRQTTSRYPATYWPQFP